MSEKLALTLLWITLCGAAAFGGTFTREFSNTYNFDGFRVSIKTVNGSVYVESWDDERVSVYAEIQVRSGSLEAARRFAEKIKIIVQQQQDELLVEADQPAFGNAGFMDWLFGGGRVNVSVDFEIKVPRGMNVTAASVNGSLDVVGVSGEVKVSTTNGRISVEEMIGPLEATTTNGSIRVDLAEIDDDEAVSLRTVNGSITLMLESDIGADVRVSTVNGKITTDFPLEIRGEWGPKRISGKIGGGGAQIRMETVNGNITIEER